MPTSPVLLFLLGLALLAGGAYSFRFLGESRRPAAASQYVLTWTGQPLSTLKYQPTVAAAILFHTVAICLLVPGTILSLSKPPTFDSLPIAPDPTSIFLTWFAEAGSVALSGFITGTILAFPLSRLRVPPIHAGLTGEGVIVGRALLPWQFFSFFSVDEGLRLVKFHSSFSPDLPSLILDLPAHISLTDLRSALRDHLPSSPPPSPSKWYRSRYLLPILVLAISIPMIWLGWIASGLPRELALFANTLLTWTLAAAGGRLIGLFGFGRAFSRRLNQSKLPTV